MVREHSTFNRSQGLRFEQFDFQIGKMMSLSALPHLLKGSGNFLPITYFCEFFSVDEEKKTRAKPKNVLLWVWFWSGPVSVLVRKIVIVLMINILFCFCQILQIPT